jgi:hypothetical protein
MSGEQLRPVRYSEASEERIRLWEISRNKTFKAVRVAPVRGLGDPAPAKHDD